MWGGRGGYPHTIIYELCELEAPGLIGQRTVLVTGTTSHISHIFTCAVQCLQSSLIGTAKNNTVQSHKYCSKHGQGEERFLNFVILTEENSRSRPSKNKFDFHTYFWCLHNLAIIMGCTHITDFDRSRLIFGEFQLRSEFVYFKIAVPDLK